MSRTELRTKMEAREGGKIMTANSEVAARHEVRSEEHDKNRINAMFMMMIIFPRFLASTRYSN